MNFKGCACHKLGFCSTAMSCNCDAEGSKAVDQGAITDKVWRERERQRETERGRDRERLADRQRQIETDRQTETDADRKTDRGVREILFVCLFGFLTSSSTTRLYRGRAPRQSVWQFYVLPHMRQSWETMTSVSAGHIIVTPTQSVGSGRAQRESNPGPPHQESRALPTELPRTLIRER